MSATLLSHFRQPLTARAQGATRFHWPGHGRSEGSPITAQRAIAPLYTCDAGSGSQHPMRRESRRALL
eukprot:8637696-Alexandrium_andersonii.AAC.1